MTESEGAETTPPLGEPSASLELDEARTGKQLRNWLISLGVLAAIVIGLLLAVPGLHKVATAVRGMPIGLVLLAIALEVLSCVGYVVAFMQVFDRIPAGFATKVALSEVGFGAAVSFFGIGNIALGAWLLVDYGMPKATVVRRSAMMLLLLGAIDVITLAFAGLGAWLGLLPGKHDLLLSLLPGGVGAGLFLVLLPLPEIVTTILKRHAQARWAPWLSTAAETIADTRRLLFSFNWRLLGVFGYVWLDVAVLGLCCHALGHTIPLSTLLLVYQIGYLSSVLPIPGGIGVLDGSFIGLLVLYGVNATLATSATLVYHAIALWVPALLGGTAFMTIRRDRSRLRVTRESPEL